MDAVVLGAGGTHGRWIHEGLVARGHRVTTVARHDAPLLRPIHPRIAQFAAFACGLANHDVIAPVLGTRRFADCATLAE